MRKTTSNDFYHSVLGGGTGADPRADGLSLTMSGCAISPNSASCERVFALLKNLFGEHASTLTPPTLDPGLGRPRRFSVWGRHMAVCSDLPYNLPRSHDSF